MFDFSWANAYAQHGLNYYPKLLTAVPFTPVRGPRLLVGAACGRASHDARAWFAAAIEYARARTTFVLACAVSGCRQRSTALRGADSIERRDCQFHWFNHGYESFEAFLATFTAEKRKKAKRERRRVAEAGIEFDTRSAASSMTALWNTIYQFYADTFYRHGHEPYLNLDFFKRVAATMPEQLMLKIARLGREPIAVAIFFVGEDALYGRYWGAGRQLPQPAFRDLLLPRHRILHREGCSRFEPGTQGEHKVPRGFVPTLTSSAHYIVDPRFAAAIRDFAAREARGVDRTRRRSMNTCPITARTDEELRL